MTETDRVGERPAKSPARVSRQPLPTRSRRAAALLVAPAVVLFSLFVVLPILIGVVSSLRSIDVTGAVSGGPTTDNYEAIFADGQFVRSLWLSVAFTVVKVPLQLALGLAVALLVMGSGRLARLVRSTVLLPSFVAIAVVGYLFSYLFDTQAGLINLLVTEAGGPRVTWLQSAHTAQFVVIATSVWRDTGIVMLVLAGGLAAIPQSMVEAARVDGASSWQSFRLVVLPLLRRSVQFAVVLATLLAAQLAVPVLLLTRGGPVGATNILPYATYDRSFLLCDWGPASAMSVVFLAVLLAVTLAELYLLRPRWEW